MGRTFAEWGVVALVAGVVAPAAAEALVVDLDLTPADFTHTRSYQTGSVTAFRESISLTREVGSIASGDAISVRLDFAEPIRLENFYPGPDLTGRCRRGVGAMSERATFIADATRCVVETGHA